MHNRTHNDHGAADSNSSHSSMRNGIFFVGIFDALVIAVDSPFKWCELQCQDG